MFTESLSLNNLKETIQAIKVIRPEVIRLFDNTVVSTDNHNSHIKYYQFPTPVVDKGLQNKLFRFNPLSMFTRAIERYEIAHETTVDDRLVYNNHIIYSPEVPGICVQELDPKFYSNPLFELPTNGINYGNIMQDPMFVNCISVKAGDGLQTYIKDKYFMSIFTGLLPINKSDEVNLYIVPYENNEFHALFTIQKKKLNPIKCLFRYKNPV